MPQIADYSVPETEGAEPQGGISPNLEAVGAAGRGLERLGGDISQAGDIVHRREAQKEVSNTYSQIANLRATYSVNLQKAALQPDFDTEKFQKQYADDVQKIGDSLNTAEGQDYFQKQASRLGGALLTQASKLQTQATYIQYKAQSQQALNLDAQAVHNSPDLFDTTVDSRKLHLAKEVEGDNTNKIAMIAPRMTQESEERLAVAALMGYADQNPGSKDRNEESDGQRKLDSGAFDKYLGPQARDQVQRYITRRMTAADIDAGAGDKAAEVQRNKDIDAADAHLTELNKKHQLTSAVIENYKGTDGQPLYKWPEIATREGWIKDNNKSDFESNDNFKADVIRRMNLPDGAEGAITSPGQVRKMFAPGKLSLKDSDAFANHLAKTDDAKDEAAAEKLFMRSAMDRIRYKEAPSAENNYSDKQWATEGDKKLGDFQKMVSTAKANMRTAGKPTADLWDSTSPAYLGGRVDDYVAGSSDRMAATSTAIKQLKDKGVPVVDENGKTGRYKGDVEAWLKANPKRSKAK